MQQPINGRLLVEITDSQYKHVKLSSDKQHQLAVSTGVVLAVAPDLTQIVCQAFKLTYDGTDKPENWPAGLPYAGEWIGKTIRWEKYAEANASFEVDDPANFGAKKKVALIEYKDVTSYES